MPTDPLDLDAIDAANEARKAVRDAASPGPWCDWKDRYSRQGGVTILDLDGRGVCKMFGEREPAKRGRIRADVEFIAHARTDDAPEVIAALSRELRGLREREAALLAAVDRMQRAFPPGTKRFVSQDHIAGWLAEIHRLAEAPDGR